MRLRSIVIAALAAVFGLAVFAGFVASAKASGPPPSFCVGGVTTTLPTWASIKGGDSAYLTQERGELYADNGNAFYAGILASNGEPVTRTLYFTTSFFKPNRFTLHSIFRGACAGPYVSPGSAVYECLKAPAANESEFQAVTVDQAYASATGPNDGKYSITLGKATFANMSASHGATCDNPAVVYGEKDQQFKVAGNKDRDPNKENNNYEYFA